MDTQKKNSCRQPGLPAFQLEHITDRESCRTRSRNEKQTHRKLHAKNGLDGQKDEQLDKWLDGRINKQEIQLDRSEHSNMTNQYKLWELEWHRYGIDHDKV